MSTAQRPLAADHLILVEAVFLIALIFASSDGDRDFTKSSDNIRGYLQLQLQELDWVAVPQWRTSSSM
jgi:hypothetical protein